MPTSIVKGKKRTAPQSTKSNKKAKLNHGGGKPVKKEKAFERPTIPIPAIQDDSDVSDEDVDFFREHEGAGDFLQSLDPTAIARSKKETQRLFEISKVPYKTREVKAESHTKGPADEESDDWSSGVEELNSESDNSEDSGDEEGSDEGTPSSLEDSEEEQSYERRPRNNAGSKQTDEPKRKVVPRLPIKLATGQVQQTGVREGSVETDEESDEELEPEPQEPPKRDVAGARFGRAAVVDIIRIKSRGERLQVAKEQIAGICQEVLGEPEQSLGLLRRLIAFASASIKSEDESGTKIVKNDPTIRQLSIISLTAIFKDIAPGYRIRKLTDKELSEKVSQAVGQTRDWEQGLVSVYQSYLQLVEKEIRERSDLLDICIRCMCTLLKDLTHFNFRTNIMSTLVARLSRKSWDASSDECLSALIDVFKHDLTGVPSLEAVRLLNRMIKERHYKVHPNVLSCLLHLRLKTELMNVRASSQHADKEKKHSESRAKARRAKGKGKLDDKPHLSKKAKKTLKETKAIRAEMDEAGAEIDREERANQHTETLKLLFVLYFSILKAAKPSPLLFAALQGIARFAHMVNVDFFRDLLAVIRDIMKRSEEPEEDVDGEDGLNESTTGSQSNLRLQILCVVTAFDLLSGQGEALNLDLNDFTIHLYKILPQLAMSSTLELDPTLKASGTIVDLLFRALNTILLPKFAKAPSYLLAAFSKRLLNLSTQTNTETTIRTLDFVKNLLGSDAKLEALLSTEERMANGVYRDDVDDPQLCNPFAAVWWEVLLLEGQHHDEKVRKAAHALRTWHPV